MNGWRKISTYDKQPDCAEDILCFFPDADTEVMIVHWAQSDDPDDEGGWYEQNPSLGYEIDVEPTHWMPLPKPPAKTKRVRA